MVCSTRRFVLFLTLCHFFLCFSVLLALRLPHLEKRELILVLFVRLFDLCLFGFVGFLFLLVSGKGCGLWLWHSLDFSLTFFEKKFEHTRIFYLKFSVFGGEIYWNRHAFVICLPVRGPLCDSLVFLCSGFRSPFSPLFCSLFCFITVFYMCFTVMFHRWVKGSLCGPNICLLFGAALELRVWFHGLCVSKTALNRTASFYWPYQGGSSVAVILCRRFHFWRLFCRYSFLILLFVWCFWVGCASWLWNCLGVFTYMLNNLPNRQIAWNANTFFLRKVIKNRMSYIIILLSALRFNKRDIWAATSENAPCSIFAQRRLRFACAFAQSDQNLHRSYFR